MKGCDVTINKHILVQSIGYFGIPALDVLSVVLAAHKNGAALPYSKWYHPPAHRKLHTLSVTGYRTITLFSWVDPVLEVFKSSWLSLVRSAHELASPVLFNNEYREKNMDNHEGGTRNLLNHRKTTNNISAICLSDMGPKPAKCLVGPQDVLFALCEGNRRVSRQLKSKRCCDRALTSE